MAWETKIQSQAKSQQRLNMVLDGALLNTQHYMVSIKSKMEQSSSALFNTSVYYLMKRECSGCPQLVVNFFLYLTKL